METEEQLKKQIKHVYTTIVRKLVDPTFKFPEGGKADIALTRFIQKFTKMYGSECRTRMVDYCVFQIHKNRMSPHQRNLAPKTFGPTAFQKYHQMTSKQKTFIENKWLEEAQLTRSQLYKLTSVDKVKHPLAKYIYMAAEECTKRRCMNTELGMVICATSTLMWSPFSDTCQQCNHSDACKEATATKYPELYRIRIEEYAKSKE
jgi:hypothetical protein